MSNTKKVYMPTKKRNINRFGYLFILPFVITFCIFSIYPVVRTLYLSFTDYKGFGEPVINGIQNYVRVFSDKFFWKALGNTIRIWGVNIVLQLGLAFLLTIVFSDIKYKMRGLPLFRALFYLPNLIACTSVAFLFKTLLDWKYGTVNQLLVNMGIIDAPVKWLESTGITPYVISVIAAWMWFGNSFIMLMAGVQGVAKELFEAAAIDGANRWVVFGKITVPMIKPILLYVTVTSLIGGLQMFDLPFLICGGTIGNPSGSTQTVVMYLYKFGFETNQVGYASAISYALFMIIFVLSMFQLKGTFSKKEE